jgi:hypothetical protein
LLTQLVSTPNERNDAGISYWCPASAWAVV